jgi:hypothetical protein
MSTRSIIGKVNEDGTISAVYCHFDGYVSGVGATLAEHYQDAAKVEALIALGDLSRLGSEIGEAHDFNVPTYTLPGDHPMRGWTRAYGRDRGEEGTEAEVCADEAAFLAKADASANGYAYLFTPEGWRAYRGGTNYGGWKHEPLTELVTKNID